MSDEKHLNEWREPGEFHISENASPEDIQAQLDAAQKRIAELNTQIAEKRIAEYRDQLLEWSDLPADQRGPAPAMPADTTDAINIAAELTDEQKRARERLIEEAIAAAKDWGLI